MISIVCTLPLFAKHDATNRPLSKLCLSCQLSRYSITNSDEHIRDFNQIKLDFFVRRCVQLAKNHTWIVLRSTSGEKERSRWTKENTYLFHKQPLKYLKVYNWKGSSKCIFMFFVSSSCHLRKFANNSAQKTFRHAALDNKEVCLIIASSLLAKLSSFKSSLHSVAYLCMFK